MKEKQVWRPGTEETGDKAQLGKDEISPAPSAAHWLLVTYNDDSLSLED